MQHHHCSVRRQKNLYILISTWDSLDIFQPPLTGTDFQFGVLLHSGISYEVTAEALVQPLTCPSMSLGISQETRFKYLDTSENAAHCDYLSAVSQLFEARPGSHTCSDEHAPGQEWFMKI